MNAAPLLPMGGPMRIATALLLCLSVVACPGAQVKEGAVASGEVDVVLRRIDVVKASWNSMDLKIIVAVENGTGSDIDITADANIALVGEAVEAAETDGATEGEADDASADDAAADAPSGLDGKRHQGAGRGTAAANTVSELPIFVTLPLPEDPETLEKILGWQKAKVHVAAKVKAGFTERTVAGERDIATPKLPKFKLKSAQVAKVDDGAAGEAFLTLLLENQNQFEIVVDNVSWRVLIADKELRTKEDGGTSIPPSSVEEYNISIPLDESGFPAKGELRGLLKKPSVPYRVDASFTARGLRGGEMFSGDMQFPR